MSIQSGGVVFKGEAAIYASKHWHNHLRLTWEGPDYDNLQYDLPVLNIVAVRFKIWFNTILNMKQHNEIYAALTPLIQKAEVSPLSVHSSNDY